MVRGGAGQGGGTGGRQREAGSRRWRRTASGGLAASMEARTDGGWAWRRGRRVGRVVIRGGVGQGGGTGDGRREAGSRR
jgi:hypothetical protein